MRLYQIFIGTLLLLMSFYLVAAEPIFSLRGQIFTQCEAGPSSMVPNFSGPNCEKLPFRDVDPQNRELWLQTELPNKALSALSDKPVGLYLMGKASSEAYINGVKVGRNGTPAKSADKEIAGKMDHVFYFPKELLEEENNKLVLHLSSHQNYLTLHSPMHFIGLSSYGDEKRFIQNFSALGLVFLGMFILSSVYFASLVIRVDNKLPSTLLLLMSTFTGCQLLAEMSRGFIDYNYPMHDLRLIGICLFASGFSMSLLSMISHKFAGTQKLHWIYGGALVTSIAILILPGFDNKTTFALILPIFVSAILLAVALKRHFSWSGTRYLAMLIIFMCSVSLSFRYFHELIFYFIVALLLTYLFVQQAKEYALEIETAQAEKALSAKLEFKLGQMQQQTKSQIINIESAGKIDRIPTTDIFYCQASGDYVEVFLHNRELLFSGSLKGIAEKLPPTFIRVHRSFIVNLEKVVGLKRDGESGQLLLSNDTKIPVSRRMMPRVKESLSTD